MGVWGIVIPNGGMLDGRCIFTQGQGDDGALGQAEGYQGRVRMGAEDAGMLVFPPQGFVCWDACAVQGDV